MTATRRNIWMSDELWAAVQRAALEESVRKLEDGGTLPLGGPVSASDWIREAIQQRLERDAA